MPRPSQIDPRERALVQLLRDERVRQGISATALAEKLKISRTTVTHLESDDARPTFWVLLKIMDGLGLDLDECCDKVKAELGTKPGQKRR